MHQSVKIIYWHVYLYCDLDYKSLPLFLRRKSFIPPTVVSDIAKQNDVYRIDLTHLSAIAIDSSDVFDIFNRNRL